MQPDFEIKHHPVDLSRHGLNPYGKPLYRVVWADSRKTKCICRGKTYILPRYMHGAEASARGHWVLERWIPAEVAVEMTRDQWEAFLAANPNAAAEAYPEQGEYELDRVFNEESGPFAKNVDEVAIHKQITFHLWTRETESAAERAQAAAAGEAKQEAAKEEKFDALFEEAREESEWSKA